LLDEITTSIIVVVAICLVKKLVCVAGNF